MNFLRRTWAEISKSALVGNINEIKKNAGEAGIFAVVKADAYGHGANLVAPVLDAAGVDGFAVSNINEATELRSFGIKKPVLILGYTPEDSVKTLAEYDISQCVYSDVYARLLSDAAAANGVKIKVHLKIDTGMSRIGFSFTEEGNFDKAGLIAAAKSAGFEVEGVFTHFACADSDNDSDIAFTEKQYNRFVSAVECLKEAGINPRYIHSDNSAAICRKKYLFSLVRPGIILYGLTPDRAFDPKLNLVPVMTLKSVVSDVKTVKAGTPVSYGRTYVAERDTKIATVAIGYADGCPRKLSNTGEVLVAGRRAKIVGRVCMDQMMIDVTGINDVKIGDEVIIFGRDLPVDNIAAICDTISYETVCGITRRVPRILVD